MGLIGGLRSAAKGIAEGSTKFDARASRTLELPHQAVFEAGTLKENIPEEVGHLSLDFGRVATGRSALQYGDYIDAHIDLSSLGKLADLLAVRTRSRDGALVSVPMEITQLDQEAVRLKGAIAGLGSCALGILLSAADNVTHANVQLGVAITPLDIRAAAETQRKSLEGLLDDAMQTFIEQYTGNIYEHVAAQQEAV